MKKIESDYEYYLKMVNLSSNAYDRHILSIKNSEIDGFNEFKIGEPFTEDEFIEQIKINKSFKNRWCKNK